ncbi:aminopeptidase A. Metallo peptidase. MEROPS family M17 [Chitinasiproducens palmae]|uniref:Probable cytosol aminopeptidase n=1 Tax=Chitinasiproducens palmae TaxID=1770053 RepID=A0A1H2PMX6_9BURK|nr:aminopeptidase A. Metallo peptidase. MEROPS family M17 [Chitinasiproducens palmae]
MDFSIKARGSNTTAGVDLLADSSDCILIGVFADGGLDGAAAALDAASDGLVGRLVADGDFDAKPGTTLMLHAVAGLHAPRVLLVGLGNREGFDAKRHGDAAQAAFKAVGSGVRRVLYTLAEQPPAGRDAAWAVRAAVLAAGYGAYRFDQMKGAPEAPKGGVEQVTITVNGESAAVREAVTQGSALVEGINLTRDLANLPPNVCTPTYLGEVAQQLARDFKLKAEVLDQKKIEALAMTSFLAVAKGSTQPPRFIVLRYQGAGASEAPVVLVGKGITFDSGGISIKPGEAMDEMKYDMCGAASVLGTLRAVAGMKLPLNVVAVVPTCENMPAGNALKPGDVIRTMSGKTVEVLNTDAEGRLILCDALTYVERFKPAAVVDVATLTGACIIALGHHNSGLFSTDDALADELVAAGRRAVDPCWRMPVEDAYQEQLKSNFADIANIGGRPAGSVTAACFLSRFAGAYPWAHLDIAGTAWKSGAAKGATGRPVPLLTEFLISRAQRKTGATQADVDLASGAVAVLDPADGQAAVLPAGKGERAGKNDKNDRNGKSKDKAGKGTKADKAERAGKTAKAGADVAVGETAEAAAASNAQPAALAESKAPGKAAPGVSAGRVVGTPAGRAKRK